jgi:hypothetical protein
MIDRVDGAALRRSVKPSFSEVTIPEIVTLKEAKAEHSGVNSGARKSVGFSAGAF